MSPYKIKYCVQVYGRYPRAEDYLDDYTAAVERMKSILSSGGGPVELHVHLCGPRGLGDTCCDNVLHNHFAFSLSLNTEGACYANANG